MSKRHLLVISVVVSLAFTAACGGDVKDDKPLSEFDRTQSESLCEELQNAGACSYETDGAETKVEPPSDCKSFADKVSEVAENECSDVTAGDVRDCQKSCSKNQEACNKYTECLATASSSEEGSSK